MYQTTADGKYLVEMETGEIVGYIKPDGNAEFYEADGK